MAETKQSESMFPANAQNTAPSIGISETSYTAYIEVLQDPLYQTIADAILEFKEIKLYNKLMGQTTPLSELLRTTRGDVGGTTAPSAHTVMKTSSEI